MDASDETFEPVPDHCEVCGVELTEAELKAAREFGGHALCAVHALEAEPGQAAARAEETDR